MKNLSFSIKIFLTFLLCTVFISAESLDDLSFYTDDYPPYNFKRDDHLQGVTVDIISEILQAAGANVARKDIKLWPWARAYDLALNEKNTVLFAMTRTKEREKLFQWVGPITTSNMVLIAKKKKNIKIESIKDLANYRLGSVNKDVSSELLLSAGIPRENIALTPYGKQCVLKLAKDRIDIWSYEENVAFWLLKEIGENPGDYEVVYIMRKSEEWYAVSNKTDIKLVKELQERLDELKATKKYQEIIDKYLK